MKKSKRLFELCGDILFPRRCPFCDAVLGFSGPCAVCGPALACIRRPLRQPVPKQGHALEHLDAAYAPYFYEPPVRDAVLRLKFENRTDLARPLALLQAEALKAAGRLGDVDALVPVPSGRGERRSRGYDVPLMLARALGRERELVELARPVPREAVAQVQPRLRAQLAHLPVAVRALRHQVRVVRLQRHCLGVGVRLFEWSQFVCAETPFGREGENTNPLDA